MRGPEPAGGQHPTGSAEFATHAPRGLVPLIALLSMVGPFTIDTYLPSFPDIARDFGVGLAATAQTMSLYLVAFAVTTLMWGPLTDSFGRRRVVLGAMGFYLLASVGCALAQNLPQLLAFRVLQGVAASGGIVIARAVIRDVYEGPQAQRAMAQVMMVFALAPAIAPIIGGWLHSWAGWRSVFVFLAFYGLATTWLVLAILPETHPQRLRQSIHPRTVAANYLQALRHFRFLGLVLAFCCSFAGLFVYIVGSPAIIFEHLGLGANHFAVQFVPMVIGVMSGSWLAGKLSMRTDPFITVWIAFAIGGLAIVLNFGQAVGLAPRPLVVIGPLVLYAFAVALMMPNLTVLALDCFPRNRGMASAVQAFLQMSINALVAGLAVPFVAPSLRRYALVQAAFLLLAVLLWQRPGRMGGTHPT